MLRCINALETVTDGQIIVNGFEVTSPKVNLNKLREHLGMVFQRFNLWPHKTVLENVMLAPQIVLGQSKEATRARALGFLKPWAWPTRPTPTSEPLGRSAAARRDRARAQRGTQGHAL